MKIKTALIMSIIIIMFDQITKYGASYFEGESYIIESLGFGLKYVTYRRFQLWRFLSIEDKSGIIFIIVVTFVLFLLYFVRNFLIFRVHNRQNLINLVDRAFILMLAGMISNQGDRIVFGCARDFLKVPYLGITNFADIFYSTGVFLFVFVALKNPSTQKGELRMFLMEEKKKLLSLFSKAGSGD